MLPLLPFLMISFNERCYALLRSVPKGKVTTYKAIADALHCKAYRAVGQAMNKNPYAPHVPCHRVISTNGRIGGFAHGQRKKIALLKREGVVITNGKIDLTRFGYCLKHREYYHFNAISQLQLGVKRDFRGLKTPRTFVLGCAQKLKVSDDSREPLG